MATQILIRKNSSEVIDKLDLLKAMIRSLLHEVTLHTQPVSIDPVKGIDFYENVARFEAQLIESALEMANGRQSKAARLLNMRASTLCSKMKQLNIRLK
jgi:DNA-binding NtrC family response regulator